MASIMAYSCANTMSAFLDARPLGEKQLAVLTDTIVFIGGEYLPPPNVLSRKEGSILIDGRVAETPVLWPQPKPPKVVVIKAPHVELFAQ
jgi:hypothetical protein